MATTVKVEDCPGTANISETGCLVITGGSTAEGSSVISNIITLHVDQSVLYSPIDFMTSHWKSVYYLIGQKVGGLASSWISSLWFVGRLFSCYCMAAPQLS